MQVEIACPSCSTPGNISIPEMLVHSSTRGLVSINVPAEYICQHNFQFFLDRNGTVRGYQKIDFQVYSSNTGTAIPEQHSTEFKCRLCNHNVQFRINDESTYLAKRAHDAYFGMQLATYKIAHVAGTEMHVNTVVVEQSGAFLGYVEAYPVPFSEFLTNGEVPKGEMSLHVVPEENVPLIVHNHVEVLCIIDTETQQILNLICPVELNIIEIAKLTLVKIQEIEKIYTVLTGNSVVNIGDRQFRLWVGGKIALVASFAIDAYLDTFDQIAQKLVEFPFDELVIKVDQVKVALKFLEEQHSASKDAQTFFRLITDDRIFSKIHPKYPENIPRILERLNKEFGVNSEILEPFLCGETSISDLLGGDLITHASEFFELIDFIDRRRLMS